MGFVLGFIIGIIAGGFIAIIGIGANKWNMLQVVHSAKIVWLWL